MRWAVLLVLLAGCAFQATSVAISGQGMMDGTETKTLECDGSGQIAIGVQGEGSVAVRVTDGGGATVYTGTFGTGQEGETKSISGAEGTWTLTVTFSGAFGFNGQYGVTLSC